MLSKIRVYLSQGNDKPERFMGTVLREIHCEPNLTIYLNRVRNSTIRSVFLKPNVNERWVLSSDIMSYDVTVLEEQQLPPDINTEKL